MDKKTFITETDEKYTKRQTAKVLAFVFVCFSLLSCMGFLISWQAFVLFESIVICSIIITMFSKNIRNHNYELRFENDHLYITNRTTNKTSEVCDISASDFMFTQTKKEKTTNYCSLLIKNTAFSFGGVKNCNELKDYISENYRQYNDGSVKITAYRKYSTQKRLLILAAVVVLGAFIVYSINSGLFSSKTPEKKTFSSNGMTITLTDQFKEATVENRTVSYDSKDVAVFALKESFALADGFGNQTLEQYAEMAKQANNLPSAETKKVSGLTYFEYEFTNPQTNDVCHYFTYVYKANDAFWLIQFATLEDNAEKYAQQITDWAKTVEFFE